MQHHAQLFPKCHRVALGSSLRVLIIAGIACLGTRRSKQTSTKRNQETTDMKQHMQGTQWKPALRAFVVAGCLLGANVWADAWKFGVMGDTQWTCSTDPANANPNHVSVSIVNQLNQQFINHGVKFVIQVGDLTDNGNDADEAVRAAAAQPLLNAGIGFFPMRGNHETYASPANNWAITAFRADYPQTRGLANTFGAFNFNSPTDVSPDLNGMTYSFDFGHAGNNARFVILDNWVTPNKNIAAAGYNYGYSFGDQQTWISSKLDKHSRRTQHAFVFSHQPLMAENHQDSPFVGYTDANPAMQNVFFASLQSNGVRYYVSGHDHVHQRSIISSPDGNSAVQEFICASVSSKFYTPKATNNANWFGQKVRETSVSQELYTVGYYIYTVDGPRVTVDYYSDHHGNWLSDDSYPGSSLPNQVTPSFTFVRKGTYGYSQNGIEILVPQGGSYQLADDTSKAIANGETGYLGTGAAILAGMNGSTNKDYTSRALTKVVDTGWTPADEDLASDILTLWGMADLGTEQTDVYVLLMTFDKEAARQDLGNGGFGIATRDASGNWVNAVAMNFGGATRFVKGSWKSSYPLGTYGVDASTKTAWAVINYNADFAVATGIEPTPGHRH